MKQPQFIEFDEQLYEARTHHKETGVPYYPDFDLGAMNVMDNHVRFRYQTMLRIKHDGQYYDVKVAEYYEVDNRNINPDIQIHILHQLMSRFTRAVNSAQLLYRTDNDEPSEYQLDEGTRTILLYHRESLSMIKTLPKLEV